MSIARHPLILFGTKPAAAGGFDADAQAFFDASGITDSTQKSAVNQLVLDLKSYGIWSKFAALYPIVGGTAATHKFNLKDPRDLDAAFRWVFSGGWTHSANGALPNGTNGFVDTMYNLSVQANINSFSWGMYFRTNADNSGQAGAFLGTSYMTVWPRNGNVCYVYSGNSTGYNFAAASSLGLYHMQRGASNACKTYRNGSVAGSATQSGTLANDTILFGYRDGGVYDNRQIALAFIATAFTDTEAANFYTAVQAFQTTLTRNV